MADINQELIDSLTTLANQAKGGGSVDANAKVKVGDKEYTVAELVQAAKESQTLKAERDAYKSKTEKFVRLLDKNLPVSDRRDILVEWFKEGGYSHAEATEMANRELAGGVSDEGDEEPEEEDEDNTTLKEIKELKAQIQSLQERTNEDFRRTALERLSQAIEDRLGKNERFRKAFEREKRLDRIDDETERKTAKDAIETLRSNAKSGVRRRAEDIIRQQYRETGTFDPAWIDKAVEKAVADEAETQKAVIALIQGVGKTPETVPTELRDFLTREPKKAPTVVDIAKMPAGEAGKAVEDFIFEGLAEAEAKQLASDGEL